MKSLNRKNGISLVVLVVTIVIMIILSTVVILILDGNGIIGNSNKSKFQTDIATMQEELSTYISSKALKNRQRYRAEKLYANSNMLQENGQIVEGKDITDVVTSITDDYLDEIEVVNGKITYIGNDLRKLQLANEILLGIRGHEVNQVIKEEERISLPDSVNLDLVNYRIYGNSIQSGTPSADNPLPIDSVGIPTVNLMGTYIDSRHGFLNPSTGGYGTDSSYPYVYIYTFSIKPNTYYTYRTYLKIDATYAFYDKDMNYLGIYGGGQASSKVPITFKTTENTAYVKINNSKTRVDNGEVNFNEGKEIIDEADNKYLIPVTVSGKNLLNIDQALNNILTKNSDGTYTITKSQAGRFSENIDIFIPANTTLARSVEIVDCSENVSKMVAVQLFFADGSDTTVPFYMNTVGTPSSDWHVISYNKDIVSLRFYLDGSYENGSYTTFKNLQLEYNDEWTEYAPYVEKTYNIYLDEPLRKIGDYVDYIDFRTQEVVRNVEVIDDTGTLPLEQSLRGLDSPIREKISLPNMLLNKGNNTLEVNTTVAPSKIETIYYTKK